MANDALSVIHIDDNVLKKLDAMDDKLERIAKSSEKTATVMMEAIDKVKNGANPLLTTLTQIAAKLDALGTSGSKGANIATSSLGGMATAAGGVNASLSQTANLLNQLSVKRPYQSLSIGELKSKIEDINKTLNRQGKSFIDELGNKQEYSVLSKNMQQHLVNTRNTLQQELKIQQASDNAKMASIKKVMDMQNADMLLSNKRITQAQKEYEATAKLKREQNYAKNTTVQGALGFSSSANTLQRQITAIEYLKKARLSLSATDSDYKTKLEAINAAISKHNAALQQAGVRSSQLAAQHRNLMDITGQLARKFALLFSISQVTGYINEVAKVRGEFELQQRSLEAILQNKTQADAIFQKTVDLAVKSPFQIKDLVSYTKQLAAYRIEGDKLYDTTKRLADVSAGLGVDMGRLILAYGQVKAAAYLRGTEVRQFTEAGINMYGELQSYFKEVKGEAYTTAQIVDMISKRMVSFEDVEAVFQRITDKGGIFYNMQEIQSETLQGKISNLKDSFDVMFNEIGKSNEGILKGTIDTAGVIVSNWEKVATVVKALIAAIVALKVANMAASESMIKLAVQNGVVHAGFTKTLTVTQLLKTGIKNIIPSINSLKLALKSIAVLAVLDFMWQFVSRWNEVRDAVSENTKEFDKARAKINGIAGAFDKLAAARDNALANKDVSFNFTENFTKETTELEKLYKELESRGLDIPVKLENVTQKNISDVFNKAKDDINKFDSVLLDAQNFIASDDKSIWSNIPVLIGHINDSFSVNAKDVEDSANAVREWASGMDNALNAVGSHYNDLSTTAKAAYNSVKSGAKENESQAQYLLRAKKAFDTVIQEFNKTTTGKPQWLFDAEDNIDGFFSSMQGKINSLNDDIYTATGDFNKFFDYLQKETLNFKGWSDKKKSVFFDYVAEKSQFGDFTKDLFMRLASQRFKFSVNVDETSVGDSISYVDKTLSDYFRKKKFSLVINTNFQSGTTDVNEFNKNFDNSIKEYKNNLKLIEQASKATIRLNEDVDNFTYANRLRKRNQELKTLITDAGRAGEIVDKQAKTRAAKAAKQERDIFTERVSVLKEMNDRYEKLRNFESDKTAAQDVMESYASSLKYVKMPQSITSNFVPTKEGLKAALKKLLPTINDFKKKAALKKDIAELEISINQEKLEKELNEAKDKVDKAFDGLTLRDKLGDMGLRGYEIETMFPGLTKSLKDVRKEIDKAYEGISGEKADKARKDAIEKANKQEIEDSRKTMQELVKNYKTQLDDQLKLDAWYVEERAKIQDNSELQRNPTLQKEMTDNLTKKYSQKTDENAWKEFQNSDFYISMFENLESTSTRVLKAMQEKLNGIRISLKNLSPEQLKQVIEQQEKLDTIVNERQPFTGLVSGIKDFIEFQKQRKQLEEEYLESLQKEDSVKINAGTQKKTVETAKNNYQSAVDNYGIQSKQAGKAKELLDIEQQKLDVLLEELVAQGKITKEYADQIRNGQKTGKSLTDRINNIGNDMQQAVAAVNGMFEAFNDWGLNIDMSDELTEILGGVDKVGQSLESIDLSKPMSVITGTIGVIGGIGKTLGGVFGWGTKDKKLQRQIERMQEGVDSLSDAYGKLKQSMDDAWDVQSLMKYKDLSEDNLKAQIRNYEAMINAEKDKKKTDDSKIKEWSKQISALKDDLNELENSYTEALGGFGSESNYKSAAQAFADAWVDAFNEGSDTLDALNDKFNEYFNNLLKRQLMNRAAKKFLDPLLSEFDNAVAEGSAGGNNGTDVTKSELDRIKQLKDTNLKAFNEYMDYLTDLLGVSPTGNSSNNLSALQQGIEGVTETTAEALEALLNSIRFFLSTQQGDVASILRIMENRFATPAPTVQTQSVQTENVASDSPILTELRAQTGIIKGINTLLESVCANNSMVKGRGIRVYMQ